MPLHSPVTDISLARSQAESSRPSLAGTWCLASECWRLACLRCFSRSPPVAASLAPSTRRECRALLAQTQPAIQQETTSWQATLSPTRQRRIVTPRVLVRFKKSVVACPPSPPLLSLCFVRSRCNFFFHFHPDMSCGVRGAGTCYAHGNTSDVCHTFPNGTSQACTANCTLDDYCQFFYFASPEGLAWDSPPASARDSTLDLAPEVNTCYLFHSCAADSSNSNNNNANTNNNSNSKSETAGIANNFRDASEAAGGGSTYTMQVTTDKLRLCLPRFFTEFPFCRAKYFVSWRKGVVHARFVWIHTTYIHTYIPYALFLSDFSYAHT